MSAERWHGTPGGYSNHGCRCDDCRKAWREHASKMRANRRNRASIPDTVRHGVVSTYTNWGCRCEPCKLARSIADAEWRLSRLRACHAAAMAGLR